MFNSKKYTLGLFIKRKDIPHPIAQDVQNECFYYILEASIMIKAINDFLHKKIEGLDCVTGDNKCQTRSLMILDLYRNMHLLQFKMQKHKAKLNILIHTINQLIPKFNKQNLTHTQIEKLKQTSILKIFEKFKIQFNPPHELKIISLCTLINLKKQDLIDMAYNKLGNKKQQRFIELAKNQLCQLTISYEKQISKNQTHQDIKKALDQIEKKEFCLLTSFFPSFTALINHMKQKEQPFLQHNIIFCSCGGLLNSTFTTWKSINNKFEPIDMNKLYFSEAIMVIVGYQYDGSFHDLKKKLELPEHLNLINFEQIKLCACETPKPPINKNNNIEEILLANSAQHPQFITGAEINWKGLGLEESALKKEFEYLQTIPGCSINDMSTFCVRHVYASTISQVIQEDQKLPHPKKQGSLYIKANKK